jgi:class 3 adenylate cyclase/DNA-binding CsgD family transcriptional regulator
MGDEGMGPTLTTVVFVDVETSAELLERVGDDTGLAPVGAQLGVVLERVEAYGGTVVRSLGDGLLLTFVSPSRAVSFALASQRGLVGSAPRVRFGVNTGEVGEIDGDPIGAAVNAAARIAARATGGEVLVSDVVRQLAGTTQAIRFVDRGRRRLEGLSERWHLWAAEDATAEQHPSATIGRVAELAVVTEMVASLAAGAGRALLLEGEAGIGKTHLLRQATARARLAGVSVVEVEADQVVRRPGAVPHGLLKATSAGMRSPARLDELLNGRLSSSAAGEDLGYAVVEASVDLVEDMSRHDPLLVAVEDLQWADDLSLAVLMALVRRAAVSRYGVIGSLRLSPRPATLDRLVEVVRDGGGRHVRLDSLDEVDVYALASSLTGAAAGEGLRERLRSAAGNPLFVTELLRCLDDDGLLRVESGIAEVTSAVMPVNLHATLVRRLSWLPSTTNELLRLASLLGNVFTLHDLASITGRTVVDVAGPLREAVIAGLVVGEADRLAFRHELIREAVYGHMLPAERRDLHRAAGHALAHAGAPARQVAEQYARGALPGDLEAVSWLERAALETAAVSPATAVTLLERAVALVPSDWTGWAALQARMIEPLALCDRFDRAEAVANMVLSCEPGPDVEYIVLRALPFVYGGRGDMTSEIAALHRAAAAPAAPADEARRWRCIATYASMLIGETSTDDTRHVAETTMAESIGAGDTTTQCVAHQTLGTIALLTGHGRDSLEHLTAAMTLVESGRLREPHYLVPDRWRALCLLELDALDEAATAADNARKRAEQLGAKNRVQEPYLIGGITHFTAGRWDDALAELEAGMAIIDDTGSRNFVLQYEAVLATIAIHRGDLSAAETLLQAGIRDFEAGVAQFGADWLFAAQAEWLAATGQHHAALKIARATWTRTGYLRYAFGYRHRGISLVRLAVATGHEELARTVTGELEEGARRSPANSAAAAALLCRSLVERDPAPALDAVTRYRQTPLRPALAACCEHTAALLAPLGRRNEAIALLNDAAAIHTDTDANADAARVDAALRQLGARRHRVIRPTFGWESLTPMESDVSRLAADGLTNPEIGARLYISRRTVETHLSHVFTKLGLTGRTHLAAELAKRTATTGR